MAMTDSRKAFLQIHFCVLLWGFTAILGKLITLPALPLTWWRMLLVVAALACVPRVWRGLRAMPARLRWAYAGIGVLVALHWLTFYGSIKLANASVGATCIALATVFTALLEPKLAGRAFSRRELLLGIAVGALSALLVAIFGSLNKRLVERADPMTMTALELGAGTLALTALAPLIALLFPAFAGDLLALPGPRDALMLLALALACTLLPFVLSLVALRHMSAFGAQLAVNMEPVYAIILAIVLLGEQHDLTPAFYAGVAIILAVVLAYPMLVRPRRIEHVEVLATGESRDVTSAG